MAESRSAKPPRLWGGSTKERAEADEWVEKFWDRRYANAQPVSLDELIEFLGVDRHDYLAALMSEAPGDAPADGRTLGRRATLHCPICGAPRTADGCDECGPDEPAPRPDWRVPTFATAVTGLSSTRYRAWAKHRRVMGHAAY